MGYMTAATTGVILTGGNTVYNEASADKDFRIESNGQTHMLFVDAGNDRVGIGTNAPSSLLHVAGTGIPTIKLEDTDAAGGYCHLEVNGSAVFIESYDEDGTVGSIIFKNATTEAMRIKYNGNVGIGTSTPAAPLHIVHSGTDDTIRLESTDAGTSLGPDLVFKRTTATPVNGDLIGSIRFLSMNSDQDDGAGTEAEHEFADIYARANDITTGSESGELYFRTFMGGTQRKRLGLALTETVFNQDGQDINLRIEGSGAANALFVEGSSGNVGLGTATPASTLDVIGDVRFRASVEVCTSDPAAANIETGTVYQFTKGSAGVFTLPASPPVGTQFVLVNGSANDIVITRPHSSVKINGATSNVTNTTAYAATSIIATVSNGNSSEWLVFGGI